MEEYQRIYEQYVEKFQHPPTQPKHLLAFSKRFCNNTNMKFMDARKIIAINQTISKSSNTKKSDTRSSTSTTTQKPNQTNTKQHVPSPKIQQLAQRRMTNMTPAIKQYKQLQKKPSFPLYKTQNTTNVTTSQSPKAEPINPKTQISAITSDDDEKKEEKKRVAAPIMCRVNFECVSESAKTEIYDALKLFVELQLNTPHPDTITYHFTCTDPIKKPLKLEFTELYFDETVFWKHAHHKSFGSAFLKAFKDQNRKSRDFITVGDNLSEMIKRINSQYDSIFPGTDAGYLLNKDYGKALDSVNDTQLMMKIVIKSPQYYRGHKHNVQLILDVMNKLAVYAQESYAIMFHSHRLAPKQYPDCVETIGIWPNDECVKAFWKKKEVQLIVEEFKELMIAETNDSNRMSHVMCELYGDKVEEEIYDMITAVFGELGVIKQIGTDIGYILHPKAISTNLP